MVPESNDSIPLYNSRIIDTYIKLIKAKYSYVNVRDLLDYAGMKPYEVADQSHWFTQSQVNKFYEKLEKLTNSNIATEAGRYSASPEALGIMRQYTLARVSPTVAYELIGKAATNFTRSGTYESRKLGINKVQIIVTPNEGVKEEPFQCKNRIGVFEAILALQNCRFHSIEHPECIFSGGEVCRYNISWEMTPGARWKRIKDFSIPVLLILVASSYFLNETVQSIIIGLLAVTTYLILALITSIKEQNEIKTSLQNTTDAVDQLIEQTDSNYNNALMTNEIGQALNIVSNISDIVDEVIHIMQKRLNYDRGLVLLANSNKTRLEVKAGYGYTDDQFKLLDKASFSLEHAESRGTFVVSFREQRPILINDISELEEVLSPHSMIFAKKFGTQSFICCPIICEGDSLGVLAVDNLRSKKPLVQSDMSLLMGIASVIGISIRNAELMEGRVRQFNSVLHALAASIDARDSLTAGHSEKVTEYSLGICNELGLARDYCEMIRVAALLHDYGKIGVEDSILKKPGELTAEEYEIVKTHAGKTREILSQISFEGIYKEVPDIAGSHHERVDGSGYPNGLKGSEIPLGAKIIGVADYFEAVTAKRHYREPMAIDEAFSSLRGEIGRYFENDIVEAMIRYYCTNCLSKPPQGPSDTKKLELRFPIHTEVKVQLGDKEIPGVSKDISLHGLYIETESSVVKGQPINLSIALTGSSNIEATGKIAWINSSSQPAKPGFPPGFGVELIDFHNATAELFLNLINSCLWATNPIKAATNSF